MVQCIFIVTFMWEINLCNKMMAYENTLVVKAKVYMYNRECHMQNSKVEYWRNLTFPWTSLRCIISLSSILKSSKIWKMPMTWIM